MNTANQHDALADVYGWLIEYRQQKTAAASQLVEGQDAATASNQTAKAARPVKSITSPGIQQVEVTL